MVESFELVQGVQINDIGGIHSAFEIDENKINAVVSGEKMPQLVKSVCGMLAEPVFFFVEVPCTDDEEKSLRKNKNDLLHYNVWYLDNCTLPVAEAIMERYGDILINDGFCGFGFGSHKSGDEIYCMKYQGVSVFSENIDVYKTAFENVGIAMENNFTTLWDKFTDENPGISIMVELNGETVYDIIENLKSEGMYLAQTCEE